MTVLYVREAGARAARDRAVAARDAPLDSLRAQLGQLQADRADLAARLRQAQDRALDPAGYEQVKACVQLYAKDEQAIARILNDPNFPADLGQLPASGTVVFAPGRSHAPTTGTDAARYLK